MQSELEVGRSKTEDRRPKSEVGIKFRVTAA